MRWECKYLLCVLVFLFKSNNNPKMCTSLPGFEPGIFWSVVRRVIRCATSPVLKTAIFPVHKRLYVSDLLFQWREIWMEYMTWWRFDRVVKPKQLQSLCIVHGTAAVGSFWRPWRETLWSNVGYCNVLCTRWDWAFLHGQSERCGCQSWIVLQPVIWFWVCGSVALCTVFRNANL